MQDQVEVMGEGEVAVGEEGDEQGEEEEKEVDQELEDEKEDTKPKGKAAKATAKTKSAPSAKTKSARTKAIALKEAQQKAKAKAKGKAKPKAKAKAKGGRRANARTPKNGDSVAKRAEFAKNTFAKRYPPPRNPERFVAIRDVYDQFLREKLFNHTICEERLIKVQTNYMF